jgi:hypothetical protein
VFLMVVQCSLLFSQEGKTVIDTILIQKDSVITDTILRQRRVSPDAINMPIIHTAKGYRRTDFINKKVYLVEKAEVKYDDIILQADSIVLSMETGVVYATGRPDSTGKLVGTPVFQQGNEKFEAKELTWNFKTKKGRVFNMVTEQDEGFLHSGVTKRIEDGSLNINMSTYSTCNATPPHFYVGFKKAKVVPGKKIITGPAYLVLEDVPLPVVLPFGFFPITKKTATSGILIPKPGQSYQLGYSMRDGGYYFAINDNFDLAVTGSIYTNGTWMGNATSSYVKKYKYSGRVSLSYANNISGHKGLTDYSKSTNYRIDWTYNQDAKAHPGSRFSANVSMSSSGFDRNNSYVASEHVTATRQSSVSYSKTWDGTPFNFSTSLNHSQNVRTKTVSLNLPKASFTMGRIYPLKGIGRTGPTKWWQELQIQYSASVDNQINTTDSLLFTKEVFKHMRNGFQHSAPVSLQIRPFRKIPSFTISPQLSYTGVLYTQKYNQRWVSNYYNPDLNKVIPSVITDTTGGFFYGQAVNTSISAGLSPQIFGTYQFKPGGKLKAIRHTIKPSIGFSYIPVLKGLSTDMYRQVQTDTLGHTKEYSVFEGGIFGTPSLGRRSGSISFNLINILEAKVNTRNDTAEVEKKIKLIDNFTMGTSYNIFADEFKWAPLSMSYRTVLFENLNIAAGSNFSFYGIDTLGRTINTSWYKQSRKLMRLTGFSLSVDFDLARLLSSKKDKNEAPAVTPGNTQPGPNGVDLNVTENAASTLNPDKSLRDQYGYSKFDAPWTMNVAYSFYLSKTSLRSTITQTLSLVGTLAITKKTNIQYTTYYDLTRRQISMASIGINRDLHCWDMSFNWIPTGTMRSWQFTIKVKASVLADLKYERRKDFHDQY